MPYKELTASQVCDIESSVTFSYPCTSSDTRYFDELVVPIIENTPEEKDLKVLNGSELFWGLYIP